MADRKKNAADLPQIAPVPTLWLLGKTGAGKSSLIASLTGLSDVAIGNGFQSCTKTSRALDFPPDAPVMRFMDTRGLGEVGYDPADDVAVLAGSAHMIVAVARLDDPVQGEVLDVLRRVGRKSPVLLVLTGGDLVEDGARARAIALTRQDYEEAVGRALPYLELSQLPVGGYTAEGLNTLVDKLSALLPEVADILAKSSAADAEAAQFALLRPRILTFAGVAGTSDIIPAVGALSVPGTQLAMMNWLGTEYGAKWSRALLMRFFIALGAGTAARYAALFGLRQLGKFIPVYGQTVVAAASGTVSFATTYALGRAAAYFLFHHMNGATPSPEALRTVYADALRRQPKDHK
ncbi:hypothetical protein BVG79_00625 [Ketogulonicigenium robustum]|uniref:G domain-containing protein n=1 Tax=Ketogulonicigenium robustum TaxID=92947 RepID=A0A1W6NY79_9RHOB|nr:GTPase [Ketogulonicigenium robustum]ARO13977.1 hypothetical protein BVG79_00625 [Ketogulonicigenium robustum]